ncbi:hypothetical protein CQ034_00405 [Microbacterium sp. MYb45]|nr:hypothetical protein CQ034_00405 [Microbacterium sp. MYb45]
MPQPSGAAVPGSAHVSRCSSSCFCAAAVASGRTDTSMSTAVSSPGSTVTDVSPLSSDTGAAATV